MTRRYLTLHPDGSVTPTPPRDPDVPGHRVELERHLMGDCYSLTCQCGWREVESYYDKTDKEAVDRLKARYAGHLK